jgi:hypothetical protein
VDARNELKSAITDNTETKDAKPVVAEKPANDGKITEATPLLLAPAKNLNINNENELSDFDNELAKLHLRWKQCEEESYQRWLVHYLKTSFEASANYKLNNEERDILLDDITATNRLLDAADNYVDSKHENDGEASPTSQNALSDALSHVLSRASEHNSSRRDIFIKVGMAMSLLVLGVAVGLLLGGISPFIVGGCLVAALLLDASAGAALIHQAKCTFFGETQKSHLLMADLAVEASKVTDEKRVGCFG